MSSDFGSIPNFDAKVALLHQVQARIWEHMVVVTIESTESGEVRKNRATGIIVSIGGHSMLATAWHVIEKFIEVREAGLNPVLRIGESDILEPHYRFLDCANDLIFIDVSDDAVAESYAKPYKLDGQWPALRVTVDQPIVITGYPAILRTQEPDSLAQDLSYFGSVESVSEFQFVVQIPNEGLFDSGRHRFPDLKSDFGGLSGAPVFALYRDRAELVGIFSQTFPSEPVWIVQSLAHVEIDLSTDSRVAV